MDLTSSSVLVTGGAGFLGSHVVEQLSAAGAACVVPRSRDYDLTRQDDVERLFSAQSFDAVVHLAAEVGGIGANQEQPGRFMYANLVMGALVMEAARATGVKKYLQTGTVCSYPKYTPVPFREESLWDGFPEETNAPYGIAKRALLVQAQSYRAQYGMNAVTLLPVNLYGPRDNFDLDSSHVIPALIRKMSEARDAGSVSVRLWGDGSASREFLFVKDAAKAVVLAMEEYDSGEPVNIGSGHEVRINELAPLVAKLVGYAGRIDWDTSRPNGQPRRCLDTTRAREGFGFVSETTLEDGLSETIRWFAEREEAITPT